MERPARQGARHARPRRQRQAPRRAAAQISDDPRRYNGSRPVGPGPAGTAGFTQTRRRLRGDAPDQLLDYIPRAQRMVTGTIVSLCNSAVCSRLPLRLSIIFLGFSRMISLYRPGVIGRFCVSRMGPWRSISWA